MTRKSAASTRPGIPNRHDPASRRPAGGAAQSSREPIDTAASADRNSCSCGGGCPRCSAGGGAALPPATEQRLERQLGADLSRVRLHTGPAAAAAVSAAGARRAFARGEDIFVGEPGFAASSTAGMALLAHEATHVIQQRLAHAASKATTALEGEARRSAEGIASGRPTPPVRAGTAPSGAVQRDEPAPTPPAAPVATDTPKLQLDPELQARFFFAQWLAQQAQGAGNADGDAAVTPITPKLLLPPPEVGSGPDFSSLLTPYYQRGLSPGGSGDTRDLDVIRQLYGDRFRFVTSLPDLRAAAPGPIRSLIPQTWRVSLAETLTSTTIDNALAHDHPTYQELANQAFDRETGATTVLLPKIKVPYINDWWNRVSGGGK